MHFESVKPLFLMFLNSVIYQNNISDVQIKKEM